MSSGEEADELATNEPITAAELANKTRIGLSRYKRMRDTLTEISGRLEDVQTMGDDDA